MLKSIVLLLCLGCILLACKPEPASSQATSQPLLSEQEARGQTIFSAKGRCSSCHSLSENTVLVGPDLANIATIAETRVVGQSAYDYLLLSILRPDSYKSPGFEQRQMDNTLAKSLTSQEVDDVVAYLLTLK